MTNGMIAMASNWKKGYGPQNATRKMTYRFGLHLFPNLLTLTKREKNLNPKATIAYKRPTTIGEKLTNYKHLALSKTNSMSKVRQGLATTAHFVVVMENTANQWYHVFHE